MRCDHDGSNLPREGSERYAWSSRGGMAAAILACLEHNPAEVERLASDLMELCTRQNFKLWLAGGAVLRGWAKSLSASNVQGLSWIENGLAELRAMGANLFVPFYLGLKAEALHAVNRISEALEAIREAEALVERFEVRSCAAELRRMRGVFLTALDGNQDEVEAAFCEAVHLSRQQESISLMKRAEATYAEYRRQKASALGGHGLRLPLS